MGLFNFNKKIKIKSNNEIMTSLINKNVKLETKIEIPENYVGLVYFRDYYQFTLPSGTHTMHKDTFYKIVQKNERKNRKSKKPKFDFNIHYITESDLDIEISFKRKNENNEKVVYTLNMKYKIDNALKFAKEILTTSYHTTSQRTLNIIHEWVDEFCNHIFNKRLSIQELSNKLKSYADKYFKHYGLNVIEIKLTGDNKVRLYDNITGDISTPLFPNQESISNSTQQEIPNSIQSQLTFNTPIDNSKYCPRCQAKLLENAFYCLRCGHKIN